MISFSDAVTAQSLAHISNLGRDRLVKVVSPAARKRLLRDQDVRGYVTQEKYLYGRTSWEIESLLGLRPFELRTICYVYSLARKPELSEVTYKMAAVFPDGKPFSEKDFDTFLQARRDYAEGKNLYRNEAGSENTSLTPVVQCYIPGSAHVPQWKLLQPMPLGGLIAHVTTQFPFPKGY